MVPLKRVDAASGVDFHTAEAECYGGCITFILTYRLPGNNASVLGCRVDEHSWVRSCAMDSESLLIGVTSSLRHVKILSAPEDFGGDIYASGKVYDPDREDDDDEDDDDDDDNNNDKDDSDNDNDDNNNEDDDE